MFTMNVSAQSEGCNDHIDSCNTPSEADCTSQWIGGLDGCRHWRPGDRRGSHSGRCEPRGPRRAPLMRCHRVCFFCEYTLSYDLAVHIPNRRASRRFAEFAELGHSLIYRIGRKSNQVYLGTICGKTLLYLVSHVAPTDTCQGVCALQLMNPSPLPPPVTTTTSPAT